MEGFTHFPLPRPGNVPSTAANLRKVFRSKSIIHINVISFKLNLREKRGTDEIMNK